MAQVPPPRSPATTVSSLSSMIEDTKRHVMSYLPPDSKVLCLAPARIYHSSFGTRGDSWTFTGLRGMLVFGRDRTTSTNSTEQDYWFRLVDVDSGKGIIWFHQIPSDFDYHADKPFFHVFSGCSRMFGFRFDEDSDAEQFIKSVASRVHITAPRSPKPRAQKSSASAAQTPAGSPRRVSPAMISAPAPGTFMHVAHIGVGDNGRIEATPNVEPGWTMVLEELQGYGVDEKMGAQDVDFVEGFLAGAKAKAKLERVQAPTPLARTATAVSGKKGRFISRKKVPGA
ncbi:hypothetical protein ONZ51_g2669 [Trametes cubensis]|uniref:Uncharacterized protein n=1 Tax=Trametes cubensis TaxID=1111947 RepID=A0AAD7U1L2_9APHY|nr:hypothetical protein ONZ51_g2669 [Trametes cubensis]